MTRIAVYLTGGIADYKAVEVVRNLQKRGHEVRVGMTKNAEKFVGKQTLAALTKSPVLDDLWEETVIDKISHIELADWSQLALVVPATANIISKLANGIADDAVSTTLLATASPIMVVPAMNTHMWEKSAVQRNITTLIADGVEVLTPAIGRLAEGYSGKGRMPEPKEISDWVTDFLVKKDNLKNKKVLITAGGTIEKIDPVRYIGNNSSGKMGIAIAQEAAKQGADVTLLVGNISVELPDNPHIKIIKTLSARDMLSELKKDFPNNDALIMAAAVADYHPKNYVDHKIKKVNSSNLTIELEENPDLLKTIAQTKRTDQVVIGFAAETNDLLKNARKKLDSKNADYIVANDVSKDVFGSDEDQVTILSKNSSNETWPRMSKKQIAKGLVNLLSQSFTD